MENFLKFRANLFYKFLTILQKSLLCTFVLNVPRTEILETPLQYRTWEKFMYELFLMFPLEPKSWSRPYIQYILYIYQLSLVPPPIFIRGGPHALVHMSQTNASPPPFDAPLAFRSRSVCVPSTMNWPSAKPFGEYIVSADMFTLI